MNTKAFQLIDYSVFVPAGAVNIIKHLDSPVDVVDDSTIFSV